MHMLGKKATLASWGARPLCPPLNLLTTKIKIKLEHWLKTLVVSHYQCFVASVLILVIVDENNFSRAV